MKLAAGQLVAYGPWLDPGARVPLVEALRAFRDRIPGTAGEMVSPPLLPVPDLRTSLGLPERFTVSRAPGPIRDALRLLHGPETLLATAAGHVFTGALVIGLVGALLIGLAILWAALTCRSGCWL